MATMTITVANDKVPRILEAYGHWLIGPEGLPTNQWVNATQQEVEAELKLQMRHRTYFYEDGKDAEQKQADKLAEVW